MPNGKKAVVRNGYLPERTLQTGIEEHQAWSRRDLSNCRYAYWWADGVYCNVRQDDKLCLLVVMGVTEHGRKELIAVEDGFRESSTSWKRIKGFD